MKTDYFETLENPFLLDIENKEEYTVIDYVNIQKKLEEKNIDHFIEFLYPKEPLRTSLVEMKRRINRGLSQKIIDTTNNVLPKIQVYKVGNGGNKKNCFVCCTPLFIDRYDASQTMLQSLQEVGFNGYFLLLNGGFPNPSGKEMKYIGILNQLSKF
jgi:hypothetical protein